VRKVLLAELGEQLRHAREARGLSLRELEQATRIRVKYLRALEQGDLDALPTEVQLRGFLRNYARQVGLEPESALLRLQQALQIKERHGWRKLFRRRRASVLPPVAPRAKPAAAPATPAATAPVASGPWLRVRRIITPDTFVSAILFVGLIAFFFWGGARMARSIRSPRPAVATPVVLGPTITPTFLSYAPATPTHPPPLVNFSDVQLTLLAEQRSFVRVTVDGALEFQGMLQRGERRDYFADEQIELTTGNGAGVRVLFNQRDEGIMGEFGEVVTWTLSPNSMSTPAPASATTLLGTPVAATAAP
jgi:transcriptional regulator with XRE-family HTH domain